MYVHYRAKVVYLAGPRSASMATATALETVGFRCIGNRQGVMGNNFHHAPLWDVRSPVTRETRAQWTVITTVRNHWDVVVSWMFKRLHYMHAIGWDIPEMERRLPTRWVSSNRLWHLHADEADLLWHYETLQEDLANTLPVFGIAVPTLLKENVTEAREDWAYQNFYTPKTRDYVGTRFADEIAHLGYCYEE